MALKAGAEKEAYDMDDEVFEVSVPKGMEAEFESKMYPRV